MGLRFTVCRAHGNTPFKVLFGKEPMLPSSLKVREFALSAALQAATEENAAEYVDALTVYLLEIHEIVRERMQLYDSRSKKYYDAQRVE